MLYPTHCRQVAYKQVDFTLNKANIERELPNHSYYRGSDYLLLENNGQWAVLVLTKDSPNPRNEIFHSLTGLRILALPAATAYVEDSAIDVLNPSALAAVAGRVCRQNPASTTVIIRGEFNHLSFIHRPEPLTLQLHDLAPPDPPKLLTQARRVIAYHDLGCPVELAPRLTDLSALAAAATTPEVILPCHGGECKAEGKTLHYLDRLPANLATDQATLIGCTRSLDIFEGHYSQAPAHYTNFCPADDEYLKARQTRPAAESLHLAKCCQISEGFEAKGNVAYVGWGSTLGDVEQALRYLVERAQEVGIAPVNESE